MKLPLEKNIGGFAQLHRLEKCGKSTTCPSIKPWTFQVFLTKIFQEMSFWTTFHPLFNWNHQIFVHTTTALESTDFDYWSLGLKSFSLQLQKFNKKSLQLKLIKQIITILIHKIVASIFSFQQLLIFLGWELDPYKWSWSGFLDWWNMLLLLHLTNGWTKTPSPLNPCDMVMWTKSPSFMGDIHAKVAWRIIPLSRWSMTAVSKSPKWGCSPFKWPKWLINWGY